MSDEQTTQDALPLDWKSYIPEALRSEKLWESVPDLPTLLKSHVDMSKYTVGAVRMPADGASADEVNAFYKKLGRPDTLDGYGLPAAPDGITVNNERLDRFRQAAHAVGLTPRQFNAMAETMLSLASEDAGALKREADEVIEGLQAEWGAAYPRKVGLAQRVINSVFGDEVAQALAQSPLGNNRHFIAGLVKLGEQLAEDGVIATSADGARSPEQARADAERLMAHPAYRDKKSPEHRAVAEQVRQLFEEAFN
jgi:hypothetical protein